MPIERPDGKKVRENCCLLPHVVDGQCENCGYNWEEEDHWTKW